MTEDIKLTGICKRYGTKQIFDGFNLSVERGEFLCITGKSGCGKTTLLNMIGLLERQEDGVVEIHGIKNPSGRAKVKLLRNHLSIYLQSGGLIEDETVDYNFAVAQHFKKMTSYQKRTEREEILKSFGLEHILDKRVYTLSGGERQRAALAQCFLKPSDIVLLDEPTNSLDQETKETVAEHIRHLRDTGKTILLVTHDPQMQSMASRVVWLDKEKD
ncbi:MAG: ATP-binding cassette domain-containing protein [Alistipes sp.]|nr:ATP-binding cassette domain-containing protein [Alistipes sp.]